MVQDLGQPASDDFKVCSKAVGAVFSHACHDGSSKVDEIQSLLVGGMLPNGLLDVHPFDDFHSFTTDIDILTLRALRNGKSTSEWSILHQRRWKDSQSFQPFRRP